jgi:hypothetical protein
MSKRICPKCGATWPKGNFCPKDGTSLQDLERPVAAPPQGKATSGERAVGKAKASADQAATRLDAPVVKAAPPKGRKPAPPDAMTVLDTPAVAAASGPPSKRAKPKMVAPSAKQLTARSKDDGAAGAPDKSEKPGRPDKGFSETQWFMKGMEVDADLLEMVETEEYDRDETIGEAERKGFTLRRDDD